MSTPIRLSSNAITILRYVADQTTALANAQRRGSPPTSMVATATGIGLGKTAEWCHRLEVAGLISMGSLGIGWLVTEEGREVLASHGGEQPSSDPAGDMETSYPEDRPRDELDHDQGLPRP